MEEYTFQARIAVCGTRKKFGMNQNTIGGVLLSPKGAPLITKSDDWENIQCEIIIRPIKRLGTAKIKNMRVDMATMALGNESNWK